MSDDKKLKRKIDKAKRRIGRFWSASIIVSVAIVCCLAWQSRLWDFRSIDEQLAAINAELAIADSENAAVYYRRFFTDPNNAAILDDLSGQTPSAYCEP